MKRKETYLLGNGKEFRKICKSLITYEVSFIENQLYYRYYICIQNLVTHLARGFLLQW